MNTPAARRWPDTGIAALAHLYRAAVSRARWLARKTREKPCHLPRLCSLMGKAQPRDRDIGHSPVVEAAMDVAMRALQFNVYLNLVIPISDDRIQNLRLPFPPEQSDVNPSLSIAFRLFLSDIGAKPTRIIRKRRAP